MNKDDIITVLQTLLNDIFIEPVVLTSDLKIKDIPEWDSLTHITIMVTIEKQFSIRFSTGETDSVQRVGDLADLIFRKTKGSSFQ